jgi:hypothetical protein
MESTTKEAQVLAPLTIGDRIPDPECDRTWDNQPIPVRDRFLTVSEILAPGLYSVKRPDGTYMVLRDSE